MNREIPHYQRQSIRLKRYDYGQVGAYFVTIVTQNRACLFGELVSDAVRLNESGEIVRGCWNEIPPHFPNVHLDDFVVMPNHLHGIIIIADSTHLTGQTHTFPKSLGDPHIVGVTHASPKPVDDTRIVGQIHTFPKSRPLPRGTGAKTLGSIIGSFKSATTRRIREFRHTNHISVWQRNYCEHIIRDEESLNSIRQYIAENPLRWASDRENPLPDTADQEVHPHDSK